MWFMTPEQITKHYVEESKDSINIVGDIMKQILDAQTEDAITKHVKKEGPPFVAKQAIHFCVTALNTSI